MAECSESYPSTPGAAWLVLMAVNLGWLTVLGAAAVILVIYGPARLYAVELTDRWLALLGRNALQVFCATRSPSTWGGPCSGAERRSAALLMREPSSSSS